MFSNESHIDCGSETYSDAPLTENEMVSITAMVEFLAFTKGNHVENTYCHLAAEFRVKDVKELKRADFDHAMKYLVDLQEQQQLKAN